MYLLDYLCDLPCAASPADYHVRGVYDSAERSTTKPTRFPRIFVSFDLKALISGASTACCSSLFRLFISRPANPE